MLSVSPSEAPKNQRTARLVVVIGPIPFSVRPAEGTRSLAARFLSSLARSQALQLVGPVENDDEASHAHPSTPILEKKTLAIGRDGQRTLTNDCGEKVLPA